MTIDEAQAIIAKTNSPYLKRDMEKFYGMQNRQKFLIVMVVLN